MHRRTHADAGQHVRQHAPHDAPRIAHDDGKPIRKGRAPFRPRFGFRIGLRLQPPHPRREVAFQFEAAEEDAAHDIDHRRPQSERTEEHRHGDFVHERRGDQKCQCHPQRNAALDEPDEQRDRRTGAEGRDRPEQRGEEILEPVQFPGGKAAAQFVDGKIGIDNAHDQTDRKQQEQNFDAVVDKEIDGVSRMRFGAHPEHAVDEPVGKSLNHRFNRNKLHHNKYLRL